ncbi:MAG TPA: ATP phosphoribosyltransferase regulatory subunit [Piscirickettsiaceae bacterium]|nr:ATP phosphoribosyltransferase regulatory subunit [Piscirickettsiaceae bacterium]HIQ40628.1 ATP phosphoribosyltransferase regulatory subunit [Sulfurivirga caldicuralii]
MSIKMSTSHIWFTPEGIEDLLPPQAEKLEFYRRELVDLFAAAGYALVIPPVAEYADSLLTGTGQDLAADTCQFVDQISGRQMGVRADMTPQIARIAASRLHAAPEHPLRLSYVGEVLRARSNTTTGSRSPYQVGVELFNQPGVAGDMEVLLLMLEAMEALGLAPVTLSLGHAGLIKTVIAESGLNEMQAEQLLDLLQRKARPEYTQWLHDNLTSLPYSLQAFFTDWLMLTGEAPQVIDQAKALLMELPDALRQIEALEQVVELLQGAMPDVRLFADLGEIRGYQYHTGMIFSTYVVNEHDQALPVAQGGRYDGMGEEFGMALSATGFSLDLRAMLDVLPPVERMGERVWAPMEADIALHDKVRDLRAEGYEVIWCRQLPTAGACLVKIDGEWVVKDDQA